MNNHTEALANIIKTGKIASAYIFAGANKDFMNKTALFFAKSLHCKSSSKDSAACGVCASCRKADNFNHPDLYHLRIHQNSKQIKIDQIRLMQKDIYLKPLESERKVYIIYDADTMAQEASNSLLKTLEEPPRGVVIMLIARHLSSIMPTLVSRSQIIKFPEDDFIDTKDYSSYIGEFIDPDDFFTADKTDFIKRSKDDQAKTLDMLLLHYRNIMVSKYSETKNAHMDGKILLSVMSEVIKAKENLFANANTKLLADSIIENARMLKNSTNIQR